MKNLLSTLIIFASTFCLNAQHLQLCGSDELRISTLEHNPEIASQVIKNDQLLEQHTWEFIHQKNPSEDTIIVPIVFHVIHENGSENITDAQIINAVDVLNKRFNKQFGDTTFIHETFKPLHAKCNIEFRLAKKDPTGHCTNGINRVESSLTNNADHNVKTLIQWPPHMYANIYVVKNAAGLAGHAVWPSDADTISEWDGIVIGHNYTGSIGTSNPTRSVVLAHEFGHYLNLHHTWGGNNVPGFFFLECAQDTNCYFDDLVDDTPNTIGWTSCNLNGTSCDTVKENVQNMMEYSYCNKMFTHGQKARMRACLNSPIAGRNYLVSEENLHNTGVLDTNNVVCWPTSNRQLEENKSIQIFPNPNTSSIFHLKSNVPLDQFSIEVYDQLSRKIAFTQSNNRIVLPTKSQGIFYIQALKDGKRISKTIHIIP